MALGNQVFKVIGMWRDNSESSQDNKYAYENFNMRIEARDGNTQLSMENERGNERIDIIGEKINNTYSDEQASISDGLLEIKGTPIGYCQIGDDILLFTTETERMSDEELQEYNEDPTYRTNKKNVFTLSSAKINSISIAQSSTLKLYLSLIETSDWVNFIDDLEIKLIFSTLKSTNTTKDQYECYNYSAIGLKTAEPINGGALYDFQVNSQIQGEYIFIHSLEFRYNDNLAGIVDLRKLFPLNDYKYEMMNSIFTFPYYNQSQTDFTVDFTTSGSYDTQMYDASAINGDTIRNGNIITFDPNINYTDTINQVFVQDITNNELSGLICDYNHHTNIARVDDESITIPNNAKHSEVVILRCSDEPEDPSLIDVTSISCSPSSIYIPVGGTFDITVNHMPSNAQCTATCSYADQYIQLVSRNNNVFTFKMLTYGGAEERTINFSCVEKPRLTTSSIIHKGETRLINTPSTFTFGPEGNEEFNVKIYSNIYSASDFSAYVDGIEITDEIDLPDGTFIYTVSGFSDVQGANYNIYLDVYAKAISQFADSDRHAELSIYLPGHIFFTSITLNQQHYQNNPSSGGGGSGENEDDEQVNVI